MKNSTKRIGWIDIIKGICMVSIVFFHINYKSTIKSFNSIWNYFLQISELYKVTIFYCVAGLTLNNEKLKNTFDFLIHKFKKLYLKALVIGLSAVFLHNIFINIGFYKLGFSYSGKVMYEYSINDYIFNSIKTVVLANREVILGAFWFVYSLIICFIILACIECILTKIDMIKNKRVCRLFITFLLMFVSIFISNIFSITIPRFSNTIVGLFLLDFTNYLFEAKKLEVENRYLNFICLINLMLAPCFGEIVMNMNMISSPYFLIVVVISALYLLIMIAKKMENIKLFNFFKYIGKYSFCIMAFHFIGFKFGGIILNLAGIKTDIGLLMPNAYNSLYVLYYLIFGISISLIINYILKRFVGIKL